MKVLAALCALLAAAPAGAVTLTIVETSDVHGWYMSRPSQEHPDRKIGGAAALATFVERQPQPLLLLDAGDWFQGTPEGTLSRGEASVRLINALGYDAVSVGNHDYDLGEANLKSLVSQLKVPVLSANVYDAKTGKRVPYLTPWIVKDVGGVKVGLFGLLTSKMGKLSFPENVAGLEFKNEVKAAREAVKRLRREGADVVILVDHVGMTRPQMNDFTGDQEIARKVPGIDVIAGGHMHLFIREPYVDRRHGTLVFEPGSYLTAASKLTLEIDDKTRKITHASYELVDLWADKYPDDAKIAAIVADETAKVSAVYDVTIATAAGKLARNGFGESTLSDWVTDCERSKRGADLAIHNGFGVRADMGPGAVTLRDIFQVMPFDNRMVDLEMDGNLVRQVLDHGVDTSKGMVQVSGVTFGYDRTAPSGRRLRDPRVGGQPLDDARIYKVATIDYLTRGGEGYSPFSHAERTTPTNILLRDLMGECAREQGTISVPPGGRMRNEGPPPAPEAH